MTAVAGVVLAAGASRRMGRPKQLLPLAGRPLLQHVLDAAAASGLGEIVVVLGHQAETIGRALTLPPRARTVVNAAHAAGQATSLACGLAALGPEVAAAAVLLGDQPAVDAALIDAVLAAFRAGRDTAVRPVWRDAEGAAHPGHPVVLARRSWAEAAALDGDRGARELFRRHPEWVRALPMAGAPPGDIDDAADYRRASAPVRVQGG
jgi:molybdenum cofactor cytidylyltransferase